MLPKWETLVKWLLSWQNGNFELHRQLIVGCLWNDRSIIFSFVCIESQSPWHPVVHYPLATNHMMVFPSDRQSPLWEMKHSMSYSEIAVLRAKEKARCCSSPRPAMTWGAPLMPENPLLCFCWWQLSVTDCACFQHPSRRCDPSLLRTHFASWSQELSPLNHIKFKEFKTWLMPMLQGKA